ncbi:MAG TPA: class I SAM-dependent methyltransferase [Methanoregulaceae archaeon]|mgnify:CR=1 FL=1|nr:class I SAM-dependent methyltransferase [Methanoregulaceae archaeon]
MSAGGWDAHYRVRGRLYRGEVRLPPVSRGARVLDIGCGDGRALDPLSRGGCSAVGLDSSRAALTLCRTQCRCTPQQLVLADAGCLPFHDGSFDLVLMLHVIGHGYYSERSAIASEAARVTVPGGRIHLRVFSSEDLRARSGELVEEGTRLRKDGLLTHYFSEEEVIRLFPRMEAVSLETVRWPLRVRGALMMRAEIEAVFERSADDPIPGRDPGINHNG